MTNMLQSPLSIFLSPNVPWCETAAFFCPGKSEEEELARLHDSSFPIIYTPDFYYKVFNDPAYHCVCIRSNATGEIVSFAVYRYRSSNAPPPHDTPLLDFTFAPFLMIIFSFISSISLLLYSSSSEVETKDVDVYLSTFGTKEEYRQQGVGSMLMKEIKRLVRENQSPKVASYHHQSFKVSRPAPPSPSSSSSTTSMMAMTDRIDHRIVSHHNDNGDHGDLTEIGSPVTSAMVTVPMTSFKEEVIMPSSLLMGGIEKEGGDRDARARSFTITLDCTCSNTSAIAFYKAHGFKVTEHRENYYFFHDQYHDGYEMQYQEGVIRRDMT